LIVIPTRIKIRTRHLKISGHYDGVEVSNIFECVFNMHSIQGVQKKVTPLMGTLVGMLLNIQLKSIFPDTLYAG